MIKKLIELIHPLIQRSPPLAMGFGGDHRFDT